MHNIMIISCAAGGGRQEIAAARASLQQNTVRLCIIITVVKINAHDGIHDAHKFHKQGTEGMIRYHEPLFVIYCSTRGGVAPQREVLGEQ